MWEQIKKPFDDIPSIVDYIFGKVGGEDLIHGTFTSNEWNSAIVPGMTAFFVISGFFLLFSIVLIGLRSTHTAVNPAQRTSFIEGLKDIIIVTLVLFNLPILYQVLFQINDGIINGLQGSFSDMDLASTEDISETFGDDLGVLTGILIDLILLVLTLWAMFYYTMRKFTLAVFMIVGPLVVTLYLIPQTKGITLGWLKELTGTILVQSVHVITFYILSILTLASDSGIEQVFYFLLFIPVGEAVKSLLGLETNTQGKFAGAAKMTGLAAGAGMFGAAKGAFSGKNPMQSLQDARKGKSSQKGQQGTSNQSTSVANEASQQVRGTQGKSASRMLKAGKAAGGSGKFALGSMGAIAGSALGPVGSIAGAQIGGTVGDKIGGVTGRTMAPVGEKVGSYAKTGLKGSWQGAKAGMGTAKSNGKKTVGQAMGAIKGSGSGIKSAFQERKQSRSDLNQMFGQGAENNEELNTAFNQRQKERRIGYVGGMLGGEKGYEVGRKIASNRTPNPQKEMLQNIQKSPTEMKNLAKKDADGNIAPDAIQMVSTNEESFVEVTDSNNQKHVTSKMGAGNLSLKRGETQRVDMSQQMNKLSQQSPQAQISEGMMTDAGKQTVQQSQTVQRDVEVQQDVTVQDNLKTTQNVSKTPPKETQQRLHNRSENEINRPKSLT